MIVSIHLSSTANAWSGRGRSNLSKEAQTSLCPPTKSCSSWEISSILCSLKISNSCGEIWSSSSLFWKQPELPVRPTQQQCRWNCSPLSSSLMPMFWYLYSTQLEKETHVSTYLVNTINVVIGSSALELANCSLASMLLSQNTREKE